MPSGIALNRKSLGAECRRGTMWWQGYPGKAEYNSQSHDCEVLLGYFFFGRELSKMIWAALKNGYLQS